MNEQVVLDLHKKGSEEEDWGLCILIFDAIQIGAEDFVQMQMPPAERYRRLMMLCQSFGEGSVLTSHIMRVQWAGQYNALRNFCMGPASERNLRHITDSIFQYTREHPCKIVAIEG